MAVAPLQLRSVLREADALILRRIECLCLLSVQGEERPVRWPTDKLLHLSGSAMR